MNILKLLTVFLLIQVQLVSAQKPEIKTSSQLMVLGDRPCYILNIANSDSRIVEKLWESYAKETFGSKLKSQKGSKEMFAEECKYKSISSNSFAIYSAIKSVGKETSLIVWFDLGTAFLSPEYDRKASENAESMLGEFLFVIERHYADEKIETEENSVKEAERTLEKLVNQGIDFQNDIKNYEEKIVKAKQELERNGSDQESAKLILEKSKEKLNEAKMQKDKIGK
jgi:hypothetical protein